MKTHEFATIDPVHMQLITGGAGRGVGPVFAPKPLNEDPAITARINRQIQQQRQLDAQVRSGVSAGI